MILVTLGTQDKEFTRLLEAIDKQIENKVIRENVIVQAGHTKYKSDNMQIFDFIPYDEFESYINKCDILITHGGVGSIITGLKKNKKVIVAARLSEYDEHTNDHQLQILNSFDKAGYILPLNDFDKLGNIYKKVSEFKPNKYKSNTYKMTKLVKSFIDEK